MRSTEGDRSGTAVWVYDAAAGTVQSRPVEVAGVDGNDMVIAAGLKPGDEVVAAGVHVLAPGQKVTRFAAAARSERRMSDASHPAPRRPATGCRVSTFRSGRWTTRPSPATS